jgi:Multicopper oxidase
MRMRSESLGGSARIVARCMATALAPLLWALALPASAQNFFTQCPNSTLVHPAGTDLDPTAAQGYPQWPNSSTSGEPNYIGPQTYTTNAHGVSLQYTSNGGSIKCYQISGGDGYMTEADGNQTFMFSFGPLSGLDKIKNGQPGTDYPDEFNQPYCDPTGTILNYNNGQPIPYFNGMANPLFPTSGNISCGINGAVGYLPPPAYRSAVGQVVLVGNALTSTTPTGVGAVVINDPSTFPGTTPGAGYSSPPTVTFGPPDCTPLSATCIHVQATGAATIGSGSVIEVAITNPGNGYLNAPSVTFTPTGPTSSTPGTDPAAIINTGVMNGNIPAPLFAFDEDDEFFLTLTNVGMIMRPDLFEQHTVHFHGYPNASSFYDGVPDASIAINIGASFTYYYLAPDAGTYFWHCHITPPEHLQMGMVGWLFVRPRQNRVPNGTNLYYAMTGSNTGGAFGTATGPSQQSDLRTSCYSNGESNLYAGAPTTGSPSADILCSVPPPAANNSYTHTTGNKYIYNDGDGSTRYDIDVPLHIHGFDPNFHFVGMTFNPEGFSDMKDKYFLLNGRSYPDTVGVPQGSTVTVGGYVPTGTAVSPCSGTSGVPCSITLPASWTGGISSSSTATNPDPVSHAIFTQGSDAQLRPEQPATALIVLSLSGGPGGTPQRAALRIDDLDVAEYQTLASLGIPMQVVGYNAKLLRDQAGNNLAYFTNSITLGGGESLDAILDACAVRGPAPAYTCITPMPVGTYFLYTPNLDHLSNDAENFGGLMTEVVVTP